MRIDVCALAGTSNLNQMPNQCENAENSVEFSSIIKQAMERGFSNNSKSDDTATPLTQQNTDENGEIKTEIPDVTAESMILAQFTPKLNFVEVPTISLEVCDVENVVNAIEGVQVVDNSVAQPMQPQPQKPIEATDSLDQTMQKPQTMQYPQYQRVATQFETARNAQFVTVDAEQKQSVTVDKTAEFDVQPQVSDNTFNNVQPQVSVDTFDNEVATQNQAVVKDVQQIQLPTVETEKNVAQVVVQDNVQSTVENLPTQVVVEQDTVAEQTLPSVDAQIKPTAKQQIDVETVLKQTDYLQFKMAKTIDTAKTEVETVLKQTANAEMKVQTDVPNQNANGTQVDVGVTEVAKVEFDTIQPVNSEIPQQNGETFEQKNEFSQSKFAKDNSFVNAEKFEVASQEETMSTAQGTNQNRERADDSVAKDAIDSATVNVVTTQKTATLTQVEATTNAETVENVKTQILTEIYDKFQNGINQFEIKLKPNELGEVTVKMAVKGSELVIELVAHDSKTEQIILSSSNEIKEILQSQLNQTVVIDFVDNDNAQFNYNDGGQNNEQQQPENEQNQRQTEQNNLTDDFVSLIMKMQSASY